MIRIPSVLLDPSWYLTCPLGLVFLSLEIDSLYSFPFLFLSYYSKSFLSPFFLSGAPEIHHAPHHVRLRRFV